MVLSKEEIQKAIGDNRIIIEPFSEDQVGAASIDLTLGNEFRVFEKQYRAYQITELSDHKNVTKVVTNQDGEAFLLQPHETILGITREKITLAPNPADRLEGRSRFARAGLMVHISSGFVQPGVSNRQVLEIANLGPTTLALIPGTRICQLVIEEVKGEAKYTGSFDKQDNI